MRSENRKNKPHHSIAESNALACSPLASYFILSNWTLTQLSSLVMPYRSTLHLSPLSEM